MATFECKVYELRIEEHHNADALELAVVGDYRSIVRKGAYATGDMGVYIPEGAIVPEWLIEELGLTGRLAGKQKNRVKAVKLRGVLSQGLIMPVINEWKGVHTVWNGGENKGTRYPETTLFEGDDLTEFLGITKYEPVIPTCMNGEVWNAFGMTPKYDIENIKKWPDVINECTDHVTFTEKLHGTWACFGYHPDSDIPIVTSKGLSDRGLAFKFNEANERNLYVTMYDSLTDKDGVDVIEDCILAMGYYGLEDWDEGRPKEDRPIYIMGEIFGAGVQDLTYGAKGKLFRVFDIYIGQWGRGRYLDTNTVMHLCNSMSNVEYVPVLYHGPFYKAEMERYTDGKETISGEEACIREGIVIRLQTERRDDELGRVILKSVSEKYLLRRNATEYN
jgi:hypothetical protein